MKIVKSYSNKSNAKRGAKSIIGADWEKTHEVIPHEGKFALAAKAPEPAPKLAKPVQAKPATKAPKANTTLLDVNAKGFDITTVNKSTVSNPVQKVWSICQAYEDALQAGQITSYTRKMVLIDCVNAGVAYYTARTQYQAWKVSSK